MPHPISRRAFLGTAALPLLAEPVSSAAGTDFHAHIDALPTLDEVIAVSRERGVKPGIVEHAGKKEHHYPGLLSTDDDLRRFIAKLEGKPVWKGIQAEYFDWMECFSREAIAELDFVLSDALTIPDENGRPGRIWLPDYKAGAPQRWMERYTEFNVRVITKEPIDILANPTFLPPAIEAEYDSLWTRERMERVVEAAVRSNVAIEINSRYRIPKPAFLKLAKRAGARFSFGSNGHGRDVGNISYGLEMAGELGLRPENMFTPAPRGWKPVQVRSL
jgi:hypothetical protein